MEFRGKNTLFFNKNFLFVFFYRSLSTVKIILPPASWRRRASLDIRRTRIRHVADKLATMGPLGRLKLYRREHRIRCLASAQTQLAI